MLYGSYTIYRYYPALFRLIDGVAIGITCAKFKHNSFKIKQFSLEQTDRRADTQFVRVVNGRGGQKQPSCQKGKSTSIMIYMA